MDLINESFTDLADYLGLPVDQVRYITLLLLSYPVALFFRHSLHPSHTPLVVRHAVSAAIGIAMGCICFGWQMIYLFGMVGVSYLLLWMVPPSVVQRYTMAWAIGTMSAAHLYRMLTDFGGWHLDFTGPMMVIVQKVTLLSCAFHDGKSRKLSELNPDQKLQRIDTQPTPLEYLSYNFNFHSFLAGPSCTIREYLSFMDGSNISSKLLDNPNAFANAKLHSREPSYWYPVLSKLFYSLVALVVHLVLTTYYPLESIIDPVYSFPVRMVVCYIVEVSIRARYYFIWLLVDSINNATGLGFAGYDSRGNAQWDLVSNMKIWNIETAMNLRVIANDWNVMTSKWLRRTCFERAKYSPYFLSFLLSAVWHGFYPGYYLCFLYLGVANESAKKMRRLFRSYFLGNRSVKMMYDVVTWLATHWLIQFGNLPFMLLWFNTGLLYWSYYYYVPLVLPIVVTFLLPSGKRSSSQTDSKAKPLEAETVPNRSMDVAPVVKNKAE